jgi:hypothetical protein
MTIRVYNPDPWPTGTTFKRPVKRGKSASKAKRTYPERAIQKSIVAALKKHSKPQQVFWYAIPNGGRRGDGTKKGAAIAGAILKSEGVRAGVPDMGFVLPNGKAAFIEFKAKKGVQSQNQEWAEICITKLGGRYAVAHSVDEAWGILAAWGCLPSEVRK